ncbi:MAG: hypothetical protein V3T62_00785 [Alphaproteobacteria bacterium]
MHSPAGAKSAIIEDRFSLAAIAALRKLMLRRVIADRCARLGYIATMNERNGGGGSSSGNRDELQALASRFVDLWQRQLEIMAQDPGLSEMMAAYSNFGAQALGAGGARDENGTPDDSNGETANSDTSAGAAAAHASSRQRRSELDELSRRVAACEKRLAQLEKRAGAGSGSARKRTQKATT